MSLRDAAIRLTVTRKRFEAKALNRMDRDGLPILMHYQNGAMRFPLHFESDLFRLGFPHLASPNVWRRILNLLGTSLDRVLRSIKALLELDAKGALAPHRARRLLDSAAGRSKKIEVPA
ncbi:hypothetical protein [Variovorax sp. 38R]|uniref:hypothetical protein n=1 Tax=Variovorax sp. 38R TaxID=2774875 RepID=UPI00177F5392|nr:hypothetical protein [Variovorax sp. 38R]QOF76107.1 hypothetical protein IG196_17015 [Variovorax sp. 38R]